MKYVVSRKWEERAREVVELLSLSYINPDRVVVLESRGTKTRRTIARIHTLGRAMQTAMGQQPFYAIELIYECQP